MLSLPPSVRIYLATTPTDMRKSIDGLAAVVRNAWQLDPFSGYLFVFPSRRGDRIKILYWDRGGFVVYYKRLESNRFKVPLFDANAKTAELEATELSMLLDGIDTRTVRKPNRWQPPRTPAEQKMIDTR
jgi:transposase